MTVILDVITLPKAPGLESASAHGDRILYFVQIKSRQDREVVIEARGVCD